MRWTQRPSTSASAAGDSPHRSIAGQALGSPDEGSRPSWDAWNQFASDFAEATGARVVEIDDGGITGHGFYDRRRKLNAPVLRSPKRHAVPLPARPRTRPVVDPSPLWCWRWSPASTTTARR
jgi:hypothetical protein